MFNLGFKHGCEGRCNLYSDSLDYQTGYKSGHDLFYKNDPYEQIVKLKEILARTIPYLKILCPLTNSLGAQRKDLKKIIKELEEIVK